MVLMHAFLTVSLVCGLAFLVFISLAILDRFEELSAKGK